MVYEVISGRLTSSIKTFRASFLSLVPEQALQEDNDISFDKFKFRNLKNTGFSYVKRYFLQNRNFRT